MTPSGNDPALRRSRPSHQGQGKGRRSLPPATSAIIVFAKAPVAGQVKTRLCPPLTPDEAASLHGSLVLDILERCQSLKEYDRILAGTPSPHHPFFRAMEARFKIPVWDQQGDDLGARMARRIQTGARITLSFGCGHWNRHSRDPWTTAEISREGLGGS